MFIMNIVGSLASQTQIFRFFYLLGLFKDCTSIHVSTYIDNSEILPSQV